MEKPTVLKLKETETKLIQIINESNIPIFIIRPVLERIVSEVRILEQKEYEQEKLKYEESLKDKKEDE